jgi:tetratricopeptide (TPR) repeat protein
VSDSEDQADLIDDATRHFKEGRIEHALADFDRAIVAGSRSARAYHGRGLVHQNRNALGAALADFDRALALDPGHVDACFKRSAVHRMMGAFDKAAADFDHAIQLLWRQSEKKEPPLAALSTPDALAFKRPQESGSSRAKRVQA